MFNVQCHLLKNHNVCEVMWKNTVEPDGTQMTIRRMRFSCWITKAANTHSEYLILIAFPREQWLRERAPVLCLCEHFQRRYCISECRRSVGLRYRKQICGT